MLKTLKITNTGPAPELTLNLSSRLNILTGDNGLGKSFLLDIAWWALTRKWPAEVNKNLSAGLMAQPENGKKAAIEFVFKATKKEEKYTSTFDRKVQAWTGRPGRPAIPGLVIYAQVDGSFAVWDPARNDWRKKGNIDVQDRLPAYVFTPSEIWNGLRDTSGNLISNGIISDWSGWQKEKGKPFENLCSVLTALSPSDQERIEPGHLTRIHIDDPRDIPTLKMPYGASVPVMHASAGMRRIIALAYLLVWCWEEHKQACKLLGQTTSSQIVFLIDEIEAHLHPKWQRRIIQSLLNVMKSLTKDSEVQMITATHSPLILASVEPLFDPKQDAWFDLDLMEVKGQKTAAVELTKRDFEKHGDVSNWLTSEAFDLPSARSLDAEKLLDEASKLLYQQKVSKKEFDSIHQKLIAMLDPKDSFFIRWRALAEKKGLLK